MIAAALALLIASGVCQVTTWRTDAGLLRVVVCPIVSEPPASPPEEPA